MLAHAGVTDDPWTTWSFDPLAIALAVVALAFFLQGWRRLRRRRAELAPGTRIVLFCAGLAVVLVGIVSPLDAIAEGYLQSAHMLQHVLIADVGVALTLVAVRGPLAMFFLPRGLLAPLARRQWLRDALSFLLRPRVAVLLWVAVLALWHVPALYEAALRHTLLHRVEHLSFVVVGALVWALLIDPSGHRRLSVNGRIGLAVALFWIGQLLAYPFAFGFATYYDVYADQPERLLGLSPLSDQKLAGVVMMVEQAITLGVALFFLVRLARRQRSTQRPSPEPA
jgi:cytochrome c oxidase assembly factor CtaG